MVIVNIKGNYHKFEKYSKHIKETERKSETERQSTRAQQTYLAFGSARVGQQVGEVSEGPRGAQVLPAFLAVGPARTRHGGAVTSYRTAGSTAPLPVAVFVQCCVPSHAAYLGHVRPPDRVLSCHGWNRSSAS